MTHSNHMFPHLRSLLAGSILTLLASAHAQNNTASEPLPPKPAWGAPASARTTQSRHMQQNANQPLVSPVRGSLAQDFKTVAPAVREQNGNAMKTVDPIAQSLYQITLRLQEIEAKQTALGEEIRTLAKQDQLGTKKNNIDNTSTEIMDMLKILLEIRAVLPPNNFGTNQENPNSHNSTWEKWLNYSYQCYLNTQVAH